MMKFLVRFVCLMGLAASVMADDSVDYVRHIKPVLQARCYACHGVLKQEAGLRLDTASFAIKGGESGAVIKPGDPAVSPLMMRISSTDDTTRMPPEGEPLKSDEIAAFRAWITRGSVAPPDETPERDPRDHPVRKRSTPSSPMIRRKPLIRSSHDYSTVHFMGSGGDVIGWISGDIATGGGWVKMRAIPRSISGTGEIGLSSR